MSKEYTYQITVSTKDIYPDGYKVPEGFVVEEFRPPVEGESFISSLNPNTRKCITAATWPMTSPRLVIRKKKVVTFRSTGEMRTPKKGEWFLSSPYALMQVTGARWYGEYEIFERVEE